MIPKIAQARWNVLVPLGAGAVLAVGAGVKGAVDLVMKSPLYRAIRLDKIRIAALEAVLAEYLAGRAGDSIPVLGMISRDPAALRRVARVLAGKIKRKCPTSNLEVIPGQSPVGGGSLPGVEIATWVVRCVVSGLTADDLAAGLRAFSSPVVARIHEGAVVFDPRTLLAGDDDIVAAAVAAVAATAGAQ